MGLRCTHLVSVKRPDTLTFFGFKKRLEQETNTELAFPAAFKGEKRKAATLDRTEDKWEVWPDVEFEEVARQEEIEEMEELEKLSQAEASFAYHKHGKEILPNPVPENASKRATPEKEEWWDCPICERPQATDEREFNEHIDLCLSRETIWEVVQQTSHENRLSGEITPGSKRVKVEMVAWKKEKIRTNSDSKQRQLHFGWT